MHVPFNKPFHAENELSYVEQALSSGHRHGDGTFTHRCQNWLSRRLNDAPVFLTHSCTAALEMASLLVGFGPGDEVILPSFTFSSTANAIVLRGATPVFVDVDPQTQNIDPEKVAAAITESTRAIVAVHYGGVGCDMAALRVIADNNGLALIEDAAQAFAAFRDDQPLGIFGDLAAISFHDSKNVSSGEGGALVVNASRFRARAEVLWEKGTDRSRFLRGEIDKYTWVDVGSSFLPSEVTAAFLLAHLEVVDTIIAARLGVWSQYATAFTPLTESVQVMASSAECRHNGHLFYLVLPASTPRDDFLRWTKTNGVHAVFHYVPLHSSPAGLRFGRVRGSMAATDRAGSHLVRLPLYATMSQEEINHVIRTVLHGLDHLLPK